MIKNLVIVESPAKAKTIEGFLGKDFTVKSSFGHVRDLSKKQLGVDIEHDFKPKYEISGDKVKLVKELKKLASEAEIVWLASDEDREGEAISWHLTEALGLDKSKTRRIVFHEITKSAITEAIQNPRGIDKNLVDAQQARRVLDRLVGFEISPVLWRKVKPALSAGRVQSVAVRLIVEREEEIKSFKSSYNYRVTATFILPGEEGQPKIAAELSRRFPEKPEALEFLNTCVGADYQVADTETRPAKKSPAPPFTTSTLQQEASRKLGFSVAKTMMVAQQLYEAGKITYMRTDSVNLSSLAINMAKEEITSLYGEKYVKTRQYATKSKGAQEAHEAIRPTYMNHREVSGDASQKKLYDLIWKRTIASQMSDAELERTTVTISISKSPEKFVAKGEVIRFDGFLKVYLESTDDENTDSEEGILPPLKTGQPLSLIEMLATQKFSQQPPRYTEASLVKKLEELGIGRPSTYAPTISTIQKREYVVKEDRPGVQRSFDLLKLKNGKISESVKTETSGQEKNKLFPTDIGSLVNSFLVQYFENILDYNFTASVEKEFDEIAQGQKVWNQMIREFYYPFAKQVKETLEKSEKVKGERLLGTDPESGKNVYVKIGRFGPMVQIGESEDAEKPRFASLKKGQSIESLALQEALKLFDFPRTIGEYEDAEMTVAIGRFGPYVKHKSAFYSLAKTDDPASIDAERAVELIEEKRKKEKERVIRIFEEDPEVQVLNGRYGPYIAIGKSNYRIPKSTDPASLTLEQCREIAAKSDAAPKTPGKGKFRKK
ncbi:DNA topoisomerase I, bacterial [Lentimicrobium saccharophilum]|uniref:DNA topoisomerase 1 n=1 Tax=Lentimicrobium saccharophilum TaxID=1678841 RepID=A0A0S7BZG1_9BACT|nr:type I DNA topoisomerase [Lentimicrobium saccharophilum]GAP43943.1 DNA topoisomerase I, bacterial [Lentimicrobium saccharophilum]